MGNKNKIYLNDVPLNLFLKYYNSFNQNGIDNSPVYDDLKSSAVIQYGSYDSPIYISKENLTISGLDAVYFAFGITSLDTDGKTYGNPRDVYSTTLLSRAAIARIFIALRNNDFEMNRNTIEKNHGDIEFLLSDHLMGAAISESQVITISSYYEYVKYEVEVSSNENFDNTIYRNENTVSIKTISGDSKNITVTLSNEEIDLNSFLTVRYLGVYMYFKYDKVNSKFIIYISGLNEVSPKVKNGKYVYKDMNGHETYSSSYTDRFLTHQKAMRRSFNAITDNNGWEYKVMPNVISLIQDGNKNNFGFSLKYNETHKYELLDANLDEVPNSNELLDNLSPSKIPSGSKTIEEVFSTYEKFYLGSIDSLPRYKVYSSGNSLDYGLSRYFKTNTPGFSAIDETKYCVADLYRRDILLSDVVIGSLENDMTFKTTLGVSSLRPPIKPKKALSLGNFALEEFNSNDSSKIVNFQESKRTVFLARVLGLDTDAPYIALVIYMNHDKRISGTYITLAKSSDEGTDIDSTVNNKNIVKLLVTVENNEIVLKNLVTLETYSSQDIYTSDIINEKSLPTGYSDAIIFKIPVKVNDVKINEIICGIKNKEMIIIDGPDTDKDTVTVAVDTRDTGGNDDVRLKKSGSKDEYEPYSLSSNDTSLIYAPDKNYYDMLVSEDGKTYFKNVYTICNFELYNGLKIGNYQQLPKGTVKYYKNQIDPSTVIKETVSYSRINPNNDELIKTELPDGYNINEDILFYKSFKNTLFTDKLIKKFSANKLYFPDTTLILRGPEVSDNIFYNKRIAAYKDTSKNILNTKYDSSLFDLRSEVSASNGYDRVYNIAKGFSAMAMNTIPKEIRTAPSLPVNSELVNLKNIHYRLIIEDTDYITNENEEETDHYVESGLVTEDTRSIEQRLADATKYPMNFLYENKLYNELLNDISETSGKNDYLTNVGNRLEDKSTILKNNMKMIKEKSFESVSMKIAAGIASAYFNKNTDYITGSCIKITSDILSNIRLDITEPTYQASYKKAYISSSNSFKNKDSNTDIDDLLKSLLIPTEDNKLFKISNI